jgi:MOSC domain-containing protein YiiM
MNQMVATSIFKAPVAGRVGLRSTNVEGDAQGDTQKHGGTYKAVCVYSIEHYDHWSRELGRTDFTFGQFGENLTVEGMLEDEICIGDVFRVGSALIQVTQPRVPCFKLGIKMDMDEFPKMFLDSGRTGYYLRVLQEGEIGAGDLFEPISTEPERMTVRELTHLLYFDLENVEGARKALRVQGLSPGMRRSFEDRLAGDGQPI